MCRVGSRERHPRWVFTHATTPVPEDAAAEDPAEVELAAPDDVVKQAEDEPA